MSKISPSDFLIQCAKIVGAQYVLTDSLDTEPYLHEPRELFKGEALAVVRPGTTEELVAIVKLCAQAGISIVPQGGNTGLVGGQIPDNAGEQLVLSLTRLTAVREVDPASNVMVVEAGLTLAQVQEIARAHNRLFPLSLAAEGTATIGGNLAANAGGTNAIVYGVARDLVLGLEIVLASGEILSTLSPLRKDNTGYALTPLFVGSEGTLGIITAASLKLFPQPRSTQTAFIGMSSPEQALKLLMLAQEHAGTDVKTFELMPRMGVEFVLKHGTNMRDPLESVLPWYVLLELSSQRDTGLEESMMAFLEQAMEEGLVEDAALAASLDQRAQFWKLRELMSEVQKAEGGSIKHDISVSIKDVPVFLEQADAAVRAAMPGIRPVPFGHMGDGNIHYNLSQPLDMDKQAFLARWDEMNEVVHGIVVKLGGSISAEHGIGSLKRDLLPKVKSPVAMDVMRKIKDALDPQGIMNPGKVL